MMNKDWQPIETAPKDGTEIILAFADEETLGGFSWNSSYNAWQLNNSSCMVESPVAWMPMPTYTHKIKGNLPAKWREMPDGHWQYHAPGYAVYGTIVPMDDGKWQWDARVMCDCDRPDKQRTRGVALSMDGAKRIVEIICTETGTCNPINPLNG